MDIHNVGRAPCRLGQQRYGATHNSFARAYERE
jgi:hypothetical protein